MISSSSIGSGAVTVRYPSDTEVIVTFTLHPFCATAFTRVFSLALARVKSTCLVAPGFMPTPISENMMSTRGLPSSILGTTTGVPSASIRVTSDSVTLISLKMQVFSAGVSVSISQVQPSSYDTIQYPFSIFTRGVTPSSPSAPSSPSFPCAGIRLPF